MLNVFTRELPPGNFTGILMFPLAKFYLRNMKIYQDKIMNYYNNQRVRAVENSNMLARLIEIAVPDYHMDIVKYFSYARAGAIHYSKRFGIVSNVNRGYFNYNVLQDGASELYIYTENEIDIVNFDKHYIDYRPIRKIYDPKHISLTYDLEHFQVENRTKDDLVVYEIDVVMMLMMYRSWALYREVVGGSTDIRQFVAMVVIPNIIYSSFDLAFWNRFKLIDRNITDDLNIVDNKHPVMIGEYSRYSDRVAKQIIDTYKKAAHPVEKIINTIPVLNHEDMLDVLRLRNRYYTTQSLWAAWLTRADDILFLLDFMENRSIARNRDIIIELRYNMKTLTNRITQLPYNTHEPIRRRYLDYIERLKTKVEEIK